MYIRTFLARAAGILISIFLLLISLPLQAVIFTALWITLKKFPVIIQERGISLSSGRVKILKFRTMREDPAVTSFNDSDTLFIKDGGRAGITGLAKYLRLSGLDELPQLFNAASGSMNLVGPRPLVIRELEYIRERFPHHYRIRMQINSKPGITGLWQVYRNRNFGIDNLTEYDRLYEMHKSIPLYFRIIVRTLRLMIKAETSDSYFNRNNFHLSVSAFRYLYKKRINFHVPGINNKIMEINLPGDYWTVSIR